MKNFEEILNSEECPKHLCFHWLEKGNRFAPGFYKNLDEALSHAEVVEESGCGCSFGVCVRINRLEENRDWFEPCEPELEKKETIICR